MYVLLRRDSDFVFHSQNDWRPVLSNVAISWGIKQLLSCSIFAVRNRLRPPTVTSLSFCMLFECVSMSVCVCIHFFERVKALCEAPVFFHMQISHIGPSTQAFTWTCYWSSASWQNPLVQRGWLTGHQLLSAGTKLTGCRCCWLGWGLEGPVYSGRVRAVSKQTEVFFFVLFCFVFLLIRFLSFDILFLLKVVYHTEPIMRVPHGSSVGCKYGYRVDFFHGFHGDPTCVCPHMLKEWYTNKGSCWLRHWNTNLSAKAFKRDIFILCHLLSEWLANRSCCCCAD